MQTTIDLRRTPYETIGSYLDKYGKIKIKIINSTYCVSANTLAHVVGIKKINTYICQNCTCAYYTRHDSCIYCNSTLIDTSIDFISYLMSRSDVIVSHEHEIYTIKRVTNNRIRIVDNTTIQKSNRISIYDKNNLLVAQLSREIFEKYLPNISVCDHVNFDYDQSVIKQFLYFINNSTSYQIDCSVLALTDLFDLSCHVGCTDLVKLCQIAICERFDIEFGKTSQKLTN